VPLREHVNRRSPLLAPLVAVALIVPTVGVASAAGTSGSAPSTSLAGIAHEIAAAKAQVSTLDTQSEIAAERFNAGRIALGAAERVASQRKMVAAAASRRLAGMQAQVSAFAATAYMNGGTADATLGAQISDPSQFVDRQALTEQISRNQASTVASLGAAQEDQITTARAAAQAVAAQQAIVTRLAADRGAVTAAQTQALRTVSLLQTQQAKLVRAAQIAEAKAAAAAAAAKSAAERAAALQARIAAHKAALAAQSQAQALAAQAEARRAALAQKPANSPEAPPSPDPAAKPPAATPTTQDAPTATATTPPKPTPPADSDPVATGTVGGSGDGGGNASSGSAAAATAVSWARQELGKPYRWAAAGPNSFDCSGLTLFIYAKAGISLPHYSGAQFNVGRHVSRSELLPGDLVFFGSPIHHMGIYIGGGQMIHSPQTGDVVKISSISRSDWTGAVRVVG
jgi:cell wall-associated NlpC family hydrolase